METITEAFQAYNGKGKTDNKIFFLPEIKVKREKDTIYISELRKTAVGAITAVVEVHNGHVGDKAPMPVNILSDIAQKAILIRLRMQTKTAFQ